MASETKQQKHTELPWLWDELDETLRNSKGHVVLHAKYVVQDRDMNHIVLSANYHERLVGQLRQAQHGMRSALQALDAPSDETCRGLAIVSLRDHLAAINQLLTDMAAENVG